MTYGRLGVNSHCMDSSGAGSNYTATIPMIAAAGYGWTRSGIQWTDFDPKQGHGSYPSDYTVSAITRYQTLFSYAAARGVKILNGITAGPGGGSFPTRTTWTNIYVGPQTLPSGPAITSSQMAQVTGSGFVNVVQSSFIESFGGYTAGSPTLKVSTTTAPTTSTGFGINYDIVTLNGTPTGATNTSGNTVTTGSTFAQYATAAAYLVAQCPGQVWEILNEPNLTGPPTSASDYAAIVNAAGPAMKAADPTCTVLCGPLTGFGGNTLFTNTRAYLTAMHTAGLLTSSYDGFAIHTYNNNTSSAGWGTAAWDPTTDLAPRIATFNTQRAGYGDTKPLWISEYGINTDAGQVFGVSQPLQSNFLQKYAKGLLAAGAAVAISYEFFDTGVPATNGYGIVDPSLNPKPSYSAMQALITLLLSAPENGPERLGVFRLGQTPLGGQYNPLPVTTPSSGLIMPTIEVDLSFTDPWQTPDWVDVTRYITSATTKRGRQHELQRAVAGTAVLSTYNQDGRFSTFNTTGPYVNLLSGADSFFQDNSTGTWGLSGTNCTATLNKTAGYDSQPALALSSTASGNMSTKTATGASGYAVTVGKTYTAMAAFQAASLGRSIRVDIAWYNGASLLSTSTGTATADSTAYTKATCIAPAPTNATNATVIVNVLSTGAAAEVHYVTRIGLFTGDQFGTATTGWAPGGRGLTPTRSVRILATWSGTTYPVYQGLVDAWIPSFQSTKSLQTINCVDMFSILALGYLLNPAYYPSIIAADSPLMYYRLGETSGPYLTDSSGNGYTALAPGAAYTYQGVLLYDTDTALDLSAGTTSPAANIFVPGRFSAAASGTTSWTFECWIKSSSGTTQQLFEWVSGTTGGNLFVTALTMVGGKLTLKSGTQPSSAIGVGGAVSTWASDATAINDGNWHHVAVTLTQNQAATSATWALYRDGTSIGSGTGVFTWNGTSPNIGSLSWYSGGGSSQGIVNTWIGQVDELAIYQSSLSLARIQARYTAGMYFHNVEYSGARIAAALTVMGVPTAYQNIATGSSLVQNETSTVTTQQALSYIQTIEKTEQGFSYVDEAGVFVFRGRNYTWNGISQGTIDTSNTANLHAEVGSIVPEEGSVDLWNTIPVSARANAAIGVTGATQTVRDSDSAQWYGPRSLTGYTGFLMASDGAALALGQYLVNRYKVPQARVKTAVVDSLVSQGAQFPQMLGRKLLDRITVQLQPLDGTASPFSQDSYVESVSHNITPGLWTTTWALTPSEAQNYFKLDDHTNAVLVATGATNSGELSY